MTRKELQKKAQMLYHRIAETERQLRDVLDEMEEKKYKCGHNLYTIMELTDERTPKVGTRCLKCGKIMNRVGVPIPPPPEWPLCLPARRTP